MLCVDGLVDSELAIVFHNLQCAAILLNKHYCDRTPIDGRLLRESLGFIHSSLIELEDRFKDKLSECLHLGMMAFLATTFRLPGLYEQPYCKNLTNKLQLSYNATKVSIPDLPKTIDNWLMLVCLISTDNLGDSIELASWRATLICGLSWNEMRSQLKRVMWIDVFHNDLGRRAFEVLMAPLESSNVFNNAQIT